MVSLLTRLFVFSRDRFTCVFCGRSAPAVEIAVERDLPARRGGGDDVRNLYTACQECCKDKGPRTVREYREFLRWREELLGRLASL